MFIGAISLKFATNIHHLSRKNGKGFKVSRSTLKVTVTPNTVKNPLCSHFVSVSHNMIIVQIDLDVLLKVQECLIKWGQKVKRPRL